MKFRFWLAFSFLFLSAPILYAEPSSGKPVQIRGDAVEYFSEEKKAVGTGHVVIDYEGIQLEADKVTVWTETRHAIAEGHVKLTQQGSVYTGEYVEYDFAGKKGNVSKLDAAIGNGATKYYAKFDRIEKVSDAEYRALDGSLTTCCGDNPFYLIRAKEIAVYPDQKVIMRNALLYIKGVPVLFIPYYEQYFIDFARLPVELVPGKRREWGAFLLSKWRYTLANRDDLQSKGGVLVDYRAKRGWAGGVENFYKSDKLGRGSAKYYYAKDDDAPQPVNDDRYRAQWRHQAKVGEATTLSAEINKLSDEKMTRDFFYREEYQRDAVPDNYVSLITAKPEYTLSILERHRVDDFVSGVNRDPEIRFDTHNRPIFGDTPFYLRAEYQYSNLSREAAGLDEGLQNQRFDTNHTLSYAGRIGDLSVTPRLGTRQTFYSRGLEDDRDLVRGTFDPGVDFSMRFFKTYNATVKTMGLDWNGLRHIFSPTVSYNYRPNPTVSRTLLEQYDAIDALDKRNFLRFNFENKIQTKEHAPDGSLVPREIARVIPFLDYDLHTGRLENVGIESELMPYTWLGLVSSATYNARTRDFDSANFDLYMQTDRWKISAGQRYLQDGSSLGTVDLRFRLNDEWEFRTYERFEFETGDSEEFQAGVSKAFDCVILGFSYNLRERNGEDDHSFYFTLRLKDFPEVSHDLEQSYDSPRATLREKLPPERPETVPAAAAGTAGMGVKA